MHHVGTCMKPNYLVATLYPNCQVVHECVSLRLTIHAQATLYSYALHVRGSKDEAITVL